MASHVYLGTADAGIWVRLEWYSVKDVVSPARCRAGTSRCGGRWQSAPGIGSGPALGRSTACDSVQE